MMIVHGKKFWSWDFYVPTSNVFMYGQNLEYPQNIFYRPSSIVRNALFGGIC